MLPIICETSVLPRPGRARRVPIGLSDDFIFSGFILRRGHAKFTGVCVTGRALRYTPVNVSLLRFFNEPLAPLEPFQMTVGKYVGPGMRVIYRAWGNNYCTRGYHNERR